MKILTVLTYYRPHTSGLTIYAERLARAFARRGHQVTVMTTQYDKSLPRQEALDGVKIIRIPVAPRVSKGVLAPTFGLAATKLVAGHDVVQMHLPQFDAPGVALRGRLFGKPAVLTYHCDLQLPPGLFNRFVNAVVHFQNNLAGILANHIVTYTQDYADNSHGRFRFGVPPKTKGDLAFVQHMVAVLNEQGELGVVMQSSPDPEHWERPRVRVIATADGRAVEGAEIDLADPAAGLTIARTLDARRHGIDVARYFL